MSAPRNPFTVGCLVTFLCSAITLFADTPGSIKFEGILGNSGEHGEGLVKSSGKGSPRDCFGMVFDKHGTIWASAGSGRLNRYSLDGRLLAHFPIPRADHRSQMTLAGDKIVMLADRDGKLYVLDINAKPGSRPQYSKINDVSCISRGSTDGRIAYVRGDNKIFSLDMKTGQSTLLASMRKKSERCFGIEMGPDGAVFLDLNHKIHKVENGAVQEVKDARSPGANFQYLAGFWYGFVWHGTIRKYEKDFASSPGVVYGGNSGSFIGHVRSNEELSHGKNLVQIGPDVFASSGIGDIVFILEWNSKKQQFNEVRRIGSLTWHNNGIAMNDEGDILVRNGRWHWTDKPDTPFYETCGLRMDGQLAIAPDNNIVGPGLVYDSFPAWIHGDMENVGAVAQRWIKKVKLRRGITGTTAYISKKGNRSVLTVNQKGEAILYHVNGKWMPEKEANIELKTSQPVKKWNNLAIIDSENLIASGDGQIIEFAADGDKNWQEVKRWNSWGDTATERFGKKLYLSVHHGLLWVADSNRHRVLCFDQEKRQLLGQFGKTDVAGAGLDDLDHPTGICSRGNRAALVDAGNERVVKLLYSPGSAGRK